MTLIRFFREMMKTTPISAFHRAMDLCRVQRFKFLRITFCAGVNRPSIHSYSQLQGTKMRRNLGPKQTNKKDMIVSKKAPTPSPTGETELERPQKVPFVGQAVCKILMLPSSRFEVLLLLLEATLTASCVLAELYESI